MQSFEQTATCVERLRRAGIDKLNFDLLYGLPLQTVDSCLDTVAKCIELRPDRFSVFGYAHIPSFKKHQRAIDESMLPGSADRHLQSEAIADALVGAGYVRIGFDHFALPEDGLAVAKQDGRLRRNFQGYTDDQAQVLVGMGAPCTANELAQAIDQAPSAVTRLLDKLESLGCVRREAHASDRRALQIVVTDEGHGLWKRLKRRGDAVIDFAMRDLAPEERELLMNLLTRIRDSLTTP